MQLIRTLLFISMFIPSIASAEVSYERINCSWAGSIIILTVPMDTSWDFQKKEIEAEAICDSIFEYEDNIPQCESTEEE